MSRMASSITADFVWRLFSERSDTRARALAVILMLCLAISFGMVVDSSRNPSGVKVRFGDDSVEFSNRVSVVPNER